MRPISESKWWRVAQASYDPPFVTMYEKNGVVHFCEKTYSGQHMYTRITTVNNTYCVRSHKDEWRKYKCE